MSALRAHAARDELKKKCGFIAYIFTQARMISTSLPYHNLLSSEIRSSRRAALCEGVGEAPFLIFEVGCLESFNSVG